MSLIINKIFKNKSLKNDTKCKPTLLFRINSGDKFFKQSDLLKRLQIQDKYWVKKIEDFK